jgi:hypothetical protein
MRLASCGVTLVNSSSVFQLGFGAEIPPLRQVRNRQAVKKPHFFIKIFKLSYAEIQTEAL